MSEIENVSVSSMTENSQEKHGGPRMTKEALKKLCRQHDLYSVPALNDVLYLHFQGYTEIENLEEYTGLRCLWLENNGFRTISGLQHLSNLRSLYLHNNYLTSLDGLQNLYSLVTLNVAYNMISNIEHICGLPRLETLQVGHNRLSSNEELARLGRCPLLSCLDLSQNNLQYSDIVQVVGELRELRVLQLSGNPVVREIRPYRNTLVVACRNLTYLDDRPVFPVDRAAAEAWSVGGLEAERATRREWAERDHQRQRDCVNDVLRLRERVRAEKAAQGTTSSSAADMGIYVEDNGSEKLYALTPAAKEWARNRLKKVKKEEASHRELNQNDDNDNNNNDRNRIEVEKESDAHEDGVPSQQKQEHEEIDANASPNDEVFNKLLRNLADECESLELVGLQGTRELETSSDAAEHEFLEDNPDSEESNDLREMGNQVREDLKNINFVNLEELDGFTEAKDVQESKNRIELEDLDTTVNSEESRSLEAAHNNQTNNLQEISKRRKELEGEGFVKCAKSTRNFEDAKESLASRETGRGESLECKVRPEDCQPMDKVLENHKSGDDEFISLQENSSRSSKSENDEYEDCSGRSLNCQRQKEEDELLFKSCHNFLRLHTPRSLGEPLSWRNEELLGDIWAAAEVGESPPSPEFDSEAEGQAHVRRLIADHNTQPQDESDIEEILENMEFEARNIQSIYRRHNLVAMNTTSQTTSGDSDPEENRDRDVNEVLDYGMNVNGVCGSDAVPRAPVFGERWVEEARRRITEEADWLEEVESISSTSEEDETADDLSLESQEDSMAEEESSFFEEESVSSISPLRNKPREIQSILKHETVAVKGLISGYAADCESSEPKQRSEESETTSCSSLSLTSLHDSSAAESTNVCNVKLCDESDSKVHHSSTTGSATHPQRDTAITASGLVRRPDVTTWPGNATEAPSFEQNDPSKAVGFISDGPSNPTAGVHTRLVRSSYLSKSGDGNEDCLIVPTNAQVSGEDGEEERPKNILETPADEETREDVRDVPHVMKDPEILGGMESKGDVTNALPMLRDIGMRDVRTREDLAGVWQVRKREPQADEGTRVDAGAVRPVTRDSVTLAGDSTSYKNQESIFSARDALRSSHEAFVRGRNFGSLLVTRDEGSGVEVTPLLLPPSGHASKEGGRPTGRPLITVLGEDDP
ncbi:uncharacterized protein dtr [Panulirus ornatus]|uniref:uncharacterized protein dtr n=1 Tax=Panulirus ornatus TaxID=150431 RepID=UPI003A8B2941